MENCAYLRKNPGYAPVEDEFSASDVEQSVFIL